MDEENFLYIMSRSDDVINVAGHRLSSGALEEVRGISECGSFSLRVFLSPCFILCLMCVLQVVLQHSAVGDCAVVGLDDRLKGVVPLALCVLRKGKLDQVARKPGTATFCRRSACIAFSLRCRSAEDRGRNCAGNCEAGEGKHRAGGCLQEGPLCARAAKDALWEDPTLLPVQPGQRETLQGLARFLHLPLNSRLDCSRLFVHLDLRNCPSFCCFFRYIL